VRIPVDRLLLKPAVSAGMSPFVLLSLAHLFRTTTEDADPITVTALDGGLYRVDDGRHRYFASVIAGRPDVLATLEPSDQETP
jgi:hypothetical protein